MKKILFLLSFMSIMVVGFSQQTSKNYSIEGHLLDSLTKEVLPYANVGILKRSDTTFIKGTTSDNNGLFLIKGLDSGSYFLRISYMGYPSSLIPVNLNEKVSNIGNILMSKAVQNLEAVEIKADKLMYQYEADKKVYNVSEDPSVQTGSASDALQNAPGVWVDLEGNITLRGVSNVEIWINDKPSRIPADGLKTYLQQLPANTLERIEVMTNPSAKYSASGTGGIINIITKQKIKKNFLLSFGLNAGTQPQLNPWISFVWSNEKWKFNLYTAHSSMSYIWNSSSVGLVKNGINDLYSFNSSSTSRSDYTWNTAYFDSEYNFSEKTRANVYFGGSFSNGENNSSSINERYVIVDSTTFTIQRKDYNESEGNNWYLGGSFNHDFVPQRHYITLDFSLGQWLNNNTSENSEMIYSDIDRNRKFKTSNNLDGDWYDVDFKYFNNFDSISTIESGFSLNYSPFNQESPVDTFNFNSESWMHSDLFSNYKDAYSKKANVFVSWSQKIKSFTYKAGLRGEYQHNFLNSIPMASQLSRDYLGLYPSAHLSYQTKKMFSYTLSYSRRVEYPQIWYMDPFIDYQNEESIWKGNPDLKPAFTNSFEFGASKYFQKVGYLSLSLYHRRTDKSHTNTMEAVYDTYLQRYTVYSFMTNSGKDIFTGGDVTFTFRPKPNINVMINGNFYNKDIYADLGSYVVSKNQFSYDGKLIINGTFLKNYQIQMMGFYKSKNPTLQGSSKEMLFVNASLRADFFKRKFSVSLSAQDIFDTQRSSEFTETPTLVSNDKSWSNSRYYVIGLTFRFGKIELEKDQKSGQGQGQGGGVPGI